MKLFSTSKPIVVSNEVISNRGEDAYIVGNHSGLYRDQCYIGAFDGCGGSGSRRYPQLKGRTGAWVGSRATAAQTEAFLCDDRLQLYDDKSVQQLQNNLFHTLQKIQQNYSGGADMSVHSSFNKAFPTTMSLIVAEENGADSLKCEFIWAGDSRGYFLDQGGLCQITVDDINANADDAFQNLIDDGIMTNMVNGEKEFKLHYRVLELKRWRNLPAMLISATDGAFSYFQTPMEFEFLILDTLNSAKTPAEWKAMLKSRLDEIAGDDYVLAIGLFGFENFKAVGKHFSNRYSDIKGIMNQIDAIAPKQPDRIEQLRKIWNTYKIAYYRENGEK